MDKVFDALRPVNREGSYQGETRCIPTTSKNADSLYLVLLYTHSTLRISEKFGGNEAAKTSRWQGIIGYFFS